MTPYNDYDYRIQGKNELLSLKDKLTINLKLKDRPTF